MSWELRILVVGATLLTALAISWRLRAGAARRGDPVDVAPLRAMSSAVVFTRDNCANCAEVMRLLTDLQVPIRQVRIEEEVDLFERLGVAAVPLTVLTDSSGNTRAQFGGVPQRRALRRALRRAGEIPGRSPRRL